MVFSSLLEFLIRPNIQVNFLRYGHQMCTKNRCRNPIPKRRGPKRKGNEDVHKGEILLTQRIIRIHPGMNVGIAHTKSLFALCAGKVKYTSEIFNPNFDHPITMAQYGHREGQKIYKTYMHVIPHKEEIRFKLIDVV